MPETNQIVIYDVLRSPNAISTEEGELIYRKIDELFSQSKAVNLDFSKINLIISTFLNASIGQLYGVYPSDFIRDHLSITNMSPEDLNILKKVIDRAKEYFNDKDNLEDTLKKHFPDA